MNENYLKSFRILNDILLQVLKKPHIDSERILDIIFDPYLAYITHETDIFKNFVMWLYVEEHNGNIICESKIKIMKNRILFYVEHDNGWRPYNIDQLLDILEIGTDMTKEIRLEKLLFRII